MSIRALLPLFVCTFKGGKETANLVHCTSIDQAREDIRILCISNICNCPLHCTHTKWNQGLLLWNYIKIKWLFRNYYKAVKNLLLEMLQQHFWQSKFFVIQATKHTLEELNTGIKSQWWLYICVPCVLLVMNLFYLYFLRGLRRKEKKENKKLRDAAVIWISKVLNLLIKYYKKST